MNVQRLVPLSGVAAVLALVASLAVAGSTPAADASTAKVVSFYTEHDAAQVASAILLGFGALFLLVFVALLAGRFGGGLGALCLGGGVLIASGFALFACLALALGQLADDLDPAALQALNVLNQALFYPVTIGASAVLLAGGIVSLTTGLLPRWLGRPALVLAVVAAIPSHVLGGALDHIGFFGFLGLLAWMLVVSVALARRPAV